MYQIEKTFTFEAAHHLEGLPPEHKCARPHGHSYKVTICLEADALNAVGFVVDYADLDGFKHTLDTVYDHRDLNEVFLGNPTAENLAFHFYGLASGAFNNRRVQVAWVEVKETDKTAATYWEYDHHLEGDHK